MLNLYWLLVVFIQRWSWQDVKIQLLITRRKHLRIIVFRFAALTSAVLPITHNCGSITHRFVFYAQIRDPCVILTHTCYQSDRDSRRLFSASTKQNRQGSERKTVCLPTFLSAMLIGLNVISGSCISKLIGRKFTSVLSCHFLSTPWFSLGWKHVAFTWLTRAKKRSAAKSDENIVGGEKSIKAAEKILAQSR